MNIKIGDNVKVTDQIPSAFGVVTDIKSAQELLHIPSESIMIQVRCDGWNPPYRWIHVDFIQKVTR